MSVKCCIGDLLGEECHLRTFTKLKTLHKLNDLDKNDFENISFRIEGFKKKQCSTICEHHLQQYTKYYERNFRVCCDPFKEHNKRRIVGGLRVLQLQMCKNVEEEPSCDLTLIPGQKICINCYQRVLRNLKMYNCCYNPFNVHRQPDACNDLVTLDLKTCQEASHLYGNEQLLIVNRKVCRRCHEIIKSDIIKDQERQMEPFSPNNHEAVAINTISSNSDDTPVLDTQTSSIYCSASQNQRNLNAMLEALNIPLINREKLSDDKAIKKGVDVVQTAMNTVSTAVSNALGVQIPSFTNLFQLQNDSTSLQKIISNLQLKFNSELKKSVKISLLTLLPEGWSFQLVSQYFDCFRYMWNTAQRMREENGMCNICYNITYLHEDESYYII